MALPMQPVELIGSSLVTMEVQLTPSSASTDAIEDVSKLLGKTKSKTICLPFYSVRADNSAIGSLRVEWRLRPRS